MLEIFHELNFFLNGVRAMHCSDMYCYCGSNVCEFCCDFPFGCPISFHLNLGFIPSKGYTTRESLRVYGYRLYISPTFLNYLFDYCLRHFVSYSRSMFGFSTFS